MHQIVNLKSRGIWILSLGDIFRPITLLDGIRSLLALLLDAFCLLLQQSWDTVFSSIIALIALADVDDTKASLNTSYTTVWLLPLLPLLLVLSAQLAARDRALADLAVVQSTLVAIATAGRRQGAAGECKLRAACQALAASLKGYLGSNAVYQDRRYFTHLAGHAAHSVVEGCQHAAVLQQSLLRDVCAISSLSCDVGAPAFAAQVADWARELHSAVQRLAAAKHTRLPRVLLSLLRLYVVLVLPAVTAPLWQALQLESDSAGLARSVSLLFNLVMVTILTVTARLQDPFNESLMDTVSVSEVMDSLEWMLDPGSAPAAALDPETTEHVDVEVVV